MEHALCAVRDHEAVDHVVDLTPVAARLAQVTHQLLGLGAVRRILQHVAMKSVTIASSHHDDVSLVDQGKISMFESSFKSCCWQVNQSAVRCRDGVRVFFSCKLKCSKS